MDALEKSNTKLTEEVSVNRELSDVLAFWNWGLKRYGRSYIQTPGVCNDECLMTALE